jgi:hypothetical protein
LQQVRHRLPAPWKAAKDSQAAKGHPDKEPHWFWNKIHRRSINTPIRPDAPSDGKRNYYGIVIRL